MELLTDTTNINKILGEHGTPLHCAVFNGNEKIVSYLLLANADPE